MSGRKPKKNASRPDAADRYYIPYTADELAESRGQRKFLNAVNVLNARLWMCVHFAECACEAIRAGDHYRAYSYFRALDIGNEFVSASIASAIQRIREQIISNGEGNAPVAGSVNGLVKVLATYIQLRLEIHATDSIIRADRAGRSIADMLTSHDVTCGDGDKFAAYVNATFATLISALEDHYDKTALILSSRIENCRPDKAPARPAANVESVVETAADKVVAAIDEGAEKVARAVRKPRGRKPKVNVDVQEAVWNIHDREKRNAEVKRMGHGRAIRENEYLHAKNELKTYGIMSAEAYIDLLNKRTKRHSRATARRLGRK